MSKTAEQKALEAYPPHYQKLAGDGYFDMSLEKREGYIRGYDQAMQDFLEKAEEAISQISRHFIGEDYSFDQVWEQFKKYMEDED